VATDEAHVEIQLSLELYEIIVIEVAAKVIGCNGETFSSSSTQSVSIDRIVELCKSTRTRAQQ
jgi:hypothetical protein